jgi:hypothetical protein
MQTSNYEYGYLLTARGESKREVLGTVNDDGYDKKKQEIASANFVSGCQGDGNIIWFIDNNNRN